MKTNPWKGTGQKYLALLLVMVGMSVSGLARSVRVGNLNYNLDNAKMEAEVAVSGVTVTTLVIPSTIEYNEQTYTVTGIGEYAFGSQTTLKEVTLPATIHAVYTSAFSQCSNLEKVTMLGGVEAIHAGAFYKCSSLSTVELPQTLVRIYEQVFYGCSSLTSITLPNSVAFIDNEVFLGCSSLKSVTLSQTMTDIGERAFYNCSALESLTIPASVTGIGKYAFSGCTLKPLTLLAKFNSYKNKFDNLSYKSEVVTYMSEVKKVKEQLPTLTQIYALDGYVIEGLAYPLAKGVNFKITENPYPVFDLQLQSVELDGQAIKPGSNGWYYHVGLLSGSNHAVTVHFTLDGADKVQTESFKTATQEEIACHISATQTKLNVTEMYYSDHYNGQLNVTEQGFIFNNTRYPFTGDTITISGLTPNTTYYLQPYVLFDDGDLVNGYNNGACKTLSCSPTLTQSSAGATSISCDGTYRYDGSDTLATWIQVGDRVANSPAALHMTGLDPDTEYEVRFCVSYANGSYEQSAAKRIKTSALILEHQLPRVSNRGEVIVMATTNMSDTETRAGFEWRKTDAPESVPSKKAQSAIYNGALEGIIKNLDASSYYNVRPFYESEAGNRYYGEWIGFDPSDFSYFAPTVHTYAQVDFAGEAAILTGYVLQGSDEILEQGFEYWSEGIAARQGAPSEVLTIQGTGQRMTVQLFGLAGATAYGYRAYAKTSNGTTYGEEMHFTTPVRSAISNPSAEYDINDGLVRVMTLNGRILRTARLAAGQHANECLHGLPKGMYILLQNRQARKVIVR